MVCVKHLSLPSKLGEACFYVKIFKSNTKIGEAVLLTFQLTQHLRDEPLIRRLADYIGCGENLKES
jgi:hypothetical protein